jgi:putative hydrolase of the HAD superfamily
VQRGELMMIGDLYSIDVLGAWQAGWRSVWYNPSAQHCPAHLPVHEIEVHAMQDLPTLLEGPELPSLKTCLGWLQDNNASSNLLMHVQMVAACAYQMALWMVQNGTAVNPILAHRGGLLHDLAKLWPHKHEDHGLAACRWLKEKGQPVLGEIASRHLIFEILHEERKPRTWEEKLVYLAIKWSKGTPSSRWMSASPGSRPL